MLNGCYRKLNRFSGFVDLWGCLFCAWTDEPIIKMRRGTLCFSVRPVLCVSFCVLVLVLEYPAAMMPCCEMKCDGTFSCRCVFRLHGVRNNKMHSIKQCVISARISTSAAAAYRWAVCACVCARLNALSLSFILSWYLIPQCCLRIDGYNIIPHSWAASKVCVIFTFISAIASHLQPSVSLAHHRLLQ